MELIKKLLIINYHNLNKNIKILGYQDNPYKYLKISDLFILSSIYEGLPNVLLEAITFKKFVISSNCPTGPAEILKMVNMDFCSNQKIGKLKKVIFFYNNKK